jgi:hypothetical protein
MGGKLICYSSTDTNVLSCDPSGLLIDQQKYSITNVIRRSCAVRRSGKRNLFCAQLRLHPLGINICDDRAGGHRVHSNTLATAKL